MRKCTYCGAELPENAYFCGSCGHVQDDTNIIEVATARSNTPPAPLWYPGAPSAPGTSIPPPPPNQEPDSAAGWSTPPSGPSRTPWMQHSQYPVQDNQEEQRRGAVLPSPPFPGSAMGSGQPYIANAPIVQGTPQISGVPIVAGAPSSAPAYMASAPSYSPPPVHHGAPVAAAKVAGSSALKWIIISITTVVLAAGGVGIATYVLARPQPIISVTSPYRVGETLAGTSGTNLHISGQKFSPNSTVTFLLDGNPAPATPIATGDTNGNFGADLTITGAWSVGRHTLTARDANNNITKNGVTVMIVSQGQAHTPGPFGAPPDDASFSVNLSVQGHDTPSGGSFTETQSVLVTGHPDPTGGTSCRSVDNGHPQTYSKVTVDTNTSYTDTVTATCIGTYKGGKLTYTETITSDVIVYSFATCRLSSPHVLEQLSGSYTDQRMFSGTVIYPGVPKSAYTCNQANTYFFYYAGTGNWTGQVAS